jgi:hypothetical protein
MYPVSTVQSTFSTLEWLMPGLRSDKPFVNLGATQTRRRLKGFGHSVQKVQSTGRNQAAIIHTATGRHLQKLENKFADVRFFTRDDDGQVE